MRKSISLRLIPVSIAKRTTVLNHGLGQAAGQGLVRYSDNQEEIKAIRENAIDGYVAQREAYQSYREAQIRNGAPVPGPVIEFADNPDDDKQETTR